MRSGSQNSLAALKVDKTLAELSDQFGVPPLPDDLQDAPIVQIQTRQVFDIHPPELQVTEHRVPVKRCTCCGKTASPY